MGRKNHGGSRKSRNPQPKKILAEVTGTVQMSRDGFVFVCVPEEKEDIFVKSGKTRGALHGDTVRVVVTRENVARHAREGEIVEILERNRKPFVGVLHILGAQAWVLMQSRTMPYDIALEVLDEHGVPMLRSRYGKKQPSGPVSHAGALRKLPGSTSYAVQDLWKMEDGQEHEMQCRTGMKVAALVDRWDRNEPIPRGHLVDVLGEPGANETEMHAILAEYGLPYRFEPEVQRAAEAIPDGISDAERRGRKDFRDVLTFTIDPADAKDYDDALSFRELPEGNVEVGVHIADVSHYVKPGSVLDKEARERGTSVYLVDRTVPMLPEKLSNNLCSLRPGEEKLTFSAVFELTPDARVVKQDFGRSLIRSDYRFAYETAQQVIDAGQQALEMDLRGGTDKADVGDGAAMGQGALEGSVIPRSCKVAILRLWDLAAQLRKRRFAAGAISFERPEMKVEVDGTGKPIRVYEHVTREANWLIEEFMLLANRSVAEFVATGGKPGRGAAKNAKTMVYRVHDEPNELKIDLLRHFAGNFGHKLGSTGSGGQTAKALNALLDESRGKPEFTAIEELALRAMSKACYSTDNIGHYGLAFKFYTHFTSPIRRYPDTMVHRLLSLYLDGAASQDKNYYEGECQHASERELVAAAAERDSIKYKLIEFMEDKVGQEFDGHISGLTDWGMYVEIEPTHIEGMVSLREIKSDFFIFDEENYALRGRHGSRTFRLGDAVRIRVKSANLEQRLLDYELVEEGFEEVAKPAPAPCRPGKDNRRKRR